MFDKLSSIAAHVLWQIQGAVSAFLHDYFWILSIILILERNETADHLADQDANAPDVGLVGVTHICHHHLWSTVAWRATVGVRSIGLDVHHLLGEAEVNNLDVAVIVDQDVLWLQITINYSIFVQLLDS